MADADSDDQEISLLGEKNITRDALRRKRKGKVILQSFILPQNMFFA